jgi:hypothetical protein
VAKLAEGDIETKHARIGRSAPQHPRRVAAEKTRFDHGFGLKQSRDAKQQHTSIEPASAARLFDRALANAIDEFRGSFAHDLCIQERGVIERDADRARNLFGHAIDLACAERTIVPFGVVAA